MPAIPDPTNIQEPARSTQRPIDDRSWRRYQRYLRTLMQQRTSSHNNHPIMFKEICDKPQNKNKQQ